MLAHHHCSHTLSASHASFVQVINRVLHLKLMDIDALLHTEAAIPNPLAFLYRISIDHAMSHASIHIYTHFHTCTHSYPCKHSHINHHLMPSTFSIVPFAGKQAGCLRTTCHVLAHVLDHVLNHVPDHVLNQCLTMCSHVLVHVLDHVLGMCSSMCLAMCFVMQVYATREPVEQLGGGVPS